MISNTFALRSRARVAFCLAGSLLAPALAVPSLAQDLPNETSEEAMIDAPPADFPSPEREPGEPIIEVIPPDIDSEPQPRETRRETIREREERREREREERVERQRREDLAQETPQQALQELPDAQDILNARPSNPGPAIRSVPPAAAPAVDLQDGEERSLQEFLSGSLAPLSLPLSEAREGWRTLRVPRDEKAARPIFPAGDSMRRFLSEQLGNDPQVLFTQGRTLRLNNALHLIVYRAAFFTDSEANDYFEKRMANRRTPTAEEATRLMRGLLDTVTLRASLMRADELSGLQDITPFNFDARFADLSTLIANEIKKSAPRAVTRPEVAAPTAASAPPRAATVVATPKAGPQEAAARERLKQLHTALLQFRQDWDGMLPSMDDAATAQKVLAPYLPSRNAWIDPATKGLFLPNARLSKKQWSHLAPFASGLIAFYSSAPSGGRRWVLRLDGVARSITEAEWQKLKASAKIP